MRARRMCCYTWITFIEMSGVIATFKLYNCSFDLSVIWPWKTLEQKIDAASAINLNFTQISTHSAIRFTLPRKRWYRWLMIQWLSVVDGLIYWLCSESLPLVDTRILNLNRSLKIFGPHTCASYTMLKNSKFVDKKEFQNNFVTWGTYSPCSIGWLLGSFFAT